MQKRKDNLHNEECDDISFIASNWNKSTLHGMILLSDTWTLILLDISHVLAGCSASFLLAGNYYLDDNFFNNSYVMIDDVFSLLEITLVTITVHGISALQ